MSKVKFNNSNNPFFKALKEKVDNYFVQNKLKSSGNKKLYFKAIILCASALTIYLALVFLTLPAWIAIALCILLGMNMALIGFNVMHDGAHASFSSNKWVNKVCGYSLNAMGGSTHFWKVTHNINHHTYTNIEGMDGDIELEPFMRLHETQSKYWFHRFQHFYWVFLYGFSYLAWILVNDFKRYFTGNIGIDGNSKKLNKKEHFIFWATKLSYFAFYLVLPMLLVGIVKAIIGFAIVTFICGLVISIVFQLAHIVEKTQFPKPNLTSNKIEEEWAVHQLHTTANFATKNKVVSWLLGGLNFQVEHHLFPRISHIHYPHLNELIKETCLEFKVAYTEYKSIFKALYSHLVHLKRLGRC